MNTQRSSTDDRSDLLGSLLQNKDRKRGGERRTRIVRTLRIFFPLAALGLMAVVLFVSQSREDFIPPNDQYDLQKPATNELLKPRFESRDKKSRPYTITAEKAIQSETQKNKIFLDRPLADISTKSGAWLAVEADQGEYTEDRKEILLEGNVKLFEDRGYSVQTPKLRIDLREGLATSDENVQGQGPAGQLEATGLTAQQKENKIIFKGPAKLTLHNNRDAKILPQ